MRGGYSDECQACGTKFRSPIAEARHRHNFPTFCKRNKRFEQFIEETRKREFFGAPDS